MRIRRPGEKRNHSWHYDRCAGCNKPLAKDEPVKYETRVYEFNVRFLAYCRNCKTIDKEV